MSRLAQIQARFQQKQLAEKEEKMLKLLESQQQKAFERVGRGSAGSNDTYTPFQAGKVRQMFDERRQKAGVDKSYPLEPLKTTNLNNTTTTTRTSSLRNTTTFRGSSLDRKPPSLQNQNRNGVTRNTTVKSTVSRSVVQTRNGKPVINKKEVVQGIYNNNGGEETYEERRYQNGGEFDVEKNLVSMLNRHNLEDNLDDEELPNLAIEDDENENEDQEDEANLTNRTQIIRRSKIEDNVDNGNISTNIKKEEKQEFVKESEVRKTPPTKSTPSSLKKDVSKPPIKKLPSSPLTRNSTTNSQSSRTVSSPLAKNNTTAATTPSPKRSSATMASAKSAGTKGPSSKPSARSHAASAKAAAVTRDDLVPCKYCNRRFAEDRLQVHEDICARTGKKKRKQYDALKHRVQGTELEPFTKKSHRSASQKITTTTKIVQSKPSGDKRPSSGKKPDWRRKHEDFIATIRAAKMAQAHVARGGKIQDLPPPPPSYNPDYVQCPHCGRRFNESAAERHIPKCATFEHNKPKKLPPKKK